MSQRETKGVEHERVPVESRLGLALLTGMESEGVGAMLQLVLPGLMVQPGVQSEGLVVEVLRAGTGVEVLVAGTGIEVLMAGTGVEHR